MFNHQPTNTTLPVVEIFTSIQGEGVRVGHLSTFVRLALCNLRCAWCDTTYAWKKGVMQAPQHLSVPSILRHVTMPDVVLTGGEPLLHDLAPLLDVLSNTFVTIETNGTFYKPHPSVGLYSLSPKFGSSGHQPDFDVLEQYLRLESGRLQLKFVVGDLEDVSELKVILENIGASIGSVPIVVQPVGNEGEARDVICERMRHILEGAFLIDPFWSRLNLRLLPQLHRLIWQDKKGI